MAARSPKPDRIRQDGRVIEYDIVHRPRVTRRIHLEIDADGRLQVVVPGRMSRREVRRTLQESARRVDRFLIEARRRLEDLPRLAYADGEEHLFLGRRFPLRVLVAPGRRGSVRLGGARIDVVTPGGPGRVGDLLQRWYRRQALEIFGQRLAEISGAAPWTGGEVPPLRLRRMKRTWGNCSAAGLITLNPHLVKAPPELIDYVIAHEVCHLREHNHGQAFYALQQQLYPAWREARARLKAEGHVYLHE